MSGIQVELVGGPCDGTLTVLPNRQPEPEFLVQLPPDFTKWATADDQELSLRVGVYRLSDALSAAGADWTYRWAGER